MPKAPARGAAAQPHTRSFRPVLRPPNQVRVPNRRSTSVATITGQRARSTLPACDTPGAENTRSGGSGSVPRAVLAAAAWRSVTPSIAGTPHVRISRDGGRTYPARHARPLPAEPPGQPCTVPVFDPATGTGRMLALDLDPARAGRDVDDAAARHRHAPGSGRGPRRTRGPLRRPGARRRLAERRPSRLHPVRRGAAVARATRRRPGTGAALPLDRYGADVISRRPDQSSRCPAQVRRLAGALNAAGGCQGRRREPERAGGMGRAAGRARGRAAHSRGPPGGPREQCSRG